jgi:hypothetical protein
MGWIITIFIVICVLGMWLFGVAGNETTAQCIQAYGKGYQVAYSSANSGVQWCQGPNGEMKAKP